MRILVDHLKAYLLSHVLALALVLSGILAECENWVEIADFGRLRQEWFASHDTLERIFRLLDATMFARYFASWVQQVVGSFSGVVAINGKTSRVVMMI